jgi:hypothetical protein
MANHPTNLQIGIRLHRHRLLWMTAMLVLALFVPHKEAVSAPALHSAGVTLEGRWSYSYVGYSDASKARYAGTVTVDAQGVATLTGTWSGNNRDHGAVLQSGHLRVALPTVEFLFTEAKTTDGKLYNPDHFYCWVSVRSSVSLACRNVDNAGEMTARFSLSRVETDSDRAPNVDELRSRRPVPQLLKKEEAKPERLPQSDQTAAPATTPPQQRPQQATPGPVAQTKPPQETPLKPVGHCTVTRPKPGFQVYLVTCPNSQATIGRTVDSPDGWTVSEGVNATDAIEFFMTSPYGR